MGTKRNMQPPLLLQKYFLLYIEGELSCWLSFKTHFSFKNFKKMPSSEWQHWNIWPFDSLQCGWVNTMYEKVNMPLQSAFPTHCTGVWLITVTVYCGETMEGYFMMSLIWMHWWVRDKCSHMTSEASLTSNNSTQLHMECIKQVILNFTTHVQIEIINIIFFPFLFPF